MNPIYHFLARLMKKLEQQADLDVINKLLIIHFINIVALAFSLVFGVLAFVNENFTLGWFLLSTAVVFALILAFMVITGKKRTTRLLLTITSVIVLFYLLYTGGTTGLGVYWLLIFPVFSIPLFGLSRGNLISFLVFGASIAFFALQQKLQVINVYPTQQVIRLLGAYAAIHLLVYLNEFLKLHNYTVMERTIIESKNETRQKDEFLSKLSHQIRTPLNNLTVVSNLINKAKLDEEHRDLFDTILASTINLINVVNNIGKVSEVKIEKELGSQVNFDLYSSIDNTLKLFRDQHKDRLEINTRISKSIKTQYIGDPIRIKQIFLNIIENIIKANPAGKLVVNIDIDINSDTESQTDLIFRIRCPQFQLESDEFGNYYKRPDAQLIKEGSYQPDDYFIDFTIAKKIIESYGSELEIKPADDLTLLQFSLTLKKGISGTPKPEIDKDTAQLLQQKNKVELKNANILLVEDNAINQKIIILSLKNHVKNIDIANNGKDALDKFGTSKYHLVLMDIQMPVINGIAATKKIRELEATTNTQTPIIAITANALSGDKETCLAAGMNDYISKPFQVEVLVNKMKVLLEG
ncbi:MAG: response regulator [Bacteroidales bacterium]|nr:response regulator [Bacteroidales bacterium]